MIKHIWQEHKEVLEMVESGIPVRDVAASVGWAVETVEKLAAGRIILERTLMKNSKVNN